MPAKGTVDPLLIRIRRARAEAKKQERDQSSTMLDPSPDIVIPRPPEPARPPIVVGEDGEPEGEGGTIPAAAAAAATPEIMAVKTPETIDPAPPVTPTIEETGNGLDWILRR